MKPKFPVPRRMATTLRTTACHGIHGELGARMVDFHGYHLPIWYTSISEEHHATRTGAGLFDVSHMGSFRFLGEGVASWLEGLATQAVTSVPVGRCGYTHFCDETGHIIDDMIFAVVSETEIRGVPNASMIDVMSSWFRSHLPADESIELIDESEGTSILAAARAIRPHHPRDRPWGGSRCRSLSMCILRIRPVPRLDPRDRIHR